MHCTNVTGKVYKSLQESQCLSVPGIVVRDLSRMCLVYKSSDREGEVALLLARTNVKRLLAEARGLEER